jgi:hypothetical protein
MRPTTPLAFSTACFFSACLVTPLLIESPAHADDAPAAAEDATDAPLEQAHDEVFPSRCQSTHVHDALTSSRGALVRIAAPGARGLGFVFHSRDHVATAWSVVERGRGIVVHFEGGARRDATVVAIDRDADLAILELDSPAPVGPLSLAPAGADVGDPVIALGTPTNRWAGQKDHHRQMKRHKRHHSHGWREDGDVVVHPGTVTARDGDRLRSDALDSRNLGWGAPLLDCRGRVVAIGTTPFSDELSSASRLALMVEDIDDGDYHGDWSMGHGSIGLVGQIDHMRNAVFDEHDHWLGFSLGTALIGDDRWYFPLRFSATWLVGPDYEDASRNRSGHRLGGHLGLGYRAMLKGGTTPIYLVPQLGFGVRYQSLSLTTTSLFIHSECGAPTCPVEMELDESNESGWHALPTAGVGLQIGFGEIGYEFQFDTREHERSTHQLTIGGQW